MSPLEYSRAGNRWIEDESRLTVDEKVAVAILVILFAGLLAYGVWLKWPAACHL